MSEDITAKARRTWEQVFPACDVEALDDLVGDEVVSHGARPGESPGIEGVRRTMLWLGRVFAEQRWEIHHVIGDGDLVAVHATHHARHTGEADGYPAHEPGGRVRLRAYPALP